MLHGERGLQSEIQLMWSEAVASGCMIPKSAAQLGRTCTILSLAEKASPRSTSTWLRRPPRSPEASRRRRHAQSDPKHVSMHVHTVLPPALWPRILQLQVSPFLYLACSVVYPGEGTDSDWDSQATVLDEEPEEGDTNDK